MSEERLSSSRSSRGGGLGGCARPPIADIWWRGFIGLASDSVSVISSDEDAPEQGLEAFSSSGQRNTSISPLSHCMCICMP